MKRRLFLKSLAEASLTTAAVIQSGQAVANLDRLEQEIQKEGRRL
jgi:hypothetical protein